VTDLWFKGVKDPGWVDDFVAHHESWLRESTPVEWYFNLLVFTEAGVIGSQGLQSRPDATVFSNSLIGRRYQRQGYGTEARAAVLTLAFNALGAARAISDAWIANHASLRVSRKLGYVDAGTELRHPRDEPVVHQVMQLDAARFRSPVPVAVEGADALAAWIAPPGDWQGRS
jgi:RimJ/RimL family protein N-acetyltransferase